MGKLVRDKIPGIILNSGKYPKVRVLGDIEYRNALYDKLKEEVDELIESRNAEELADVLEVISCLYADDPNTYESTFIVSTNKKKEKGSFINRLYLEDYE